LELFTTMVDARIAVEQGKEQQPSHSAIDNGNPAQFKPKYLVLDDINVDLISILVITLSLLSIPIFQFPLLKAFIAAAGILIPLRSFLPPSRVPQGLALITGASSGIGA